jgi:protein-tyrosine-phosphatase/predicted ATP-grasp superfamily ATP-dependent carboligase
MHARGKVLVLDGDKIPALDIVRALGRMGLSVTVAARRDDALTFRSRYARAREIYPDPALDAASFIDWLQRTLRTDKYDLVIPVTDLTVIPIARHADALRPLAAVATESYDKVQLVSDKSRTLQLARDLGIPAPATAVVRTMEDVARCASALTYPVVCKPLSSSVWSPSGFRSFSVFYALDADELHAAMRAQLDGTCGILLQEYKRGAGVGVEVLARDGEMLQIFQHRRLHELPLTGGGSTYRVSEAVDPRLRDYSARLLGAIGWTGVAMVEFKVDDATGEAALMEVNGRFWGSLPLSTRAGMSFAGDLYEMAVLGKTPAPRAYAVGVRCRKLRDDIEWFKENLSLDRNSPMVRAGLVRVRSRGSLLAEAARLVSGRYDVQVLDDPRPGLVDLWRTARLQVGGVRRRLGRAAAKWRSRTYAWRRKSGLVDAVRRSDRLLFVCYGNIMRSPFASGYFHDRTAGNGCRVEARSAGIYERRGRDADPRAVAVARRWGVDLSSHRSTPMDDDLLGWADLILVMDRANLRDVRQRHPELARKAFLLGAIDADGSVDVEIPDPYHGEQERTEMVFGRIATAIDRLLAYRTRPHDGAA